MDAPLERYINAVRQATLKPLSDAGVLRRVEAAARELVAEGGTWGPEFRTQPPDGYGRNLVWRDPLAGFVVIAMSWPPGIVGAPHDHGTWGVVAVLEGHVRIVEFERDDDGSDTSHADLRQVAEIVAGPGDLATALPPHRDFHQVGNASAGAPALSLHTYGGDVRHCHVVDPITHRLSSRRLDYTSVLPGTVA